MNDEMVQAADLTRSKKDIPKDAKKSLRSKRDRDRQLVRGIFRYHELPGGRFDFSYREYKDDKTETYKLQDGEVVSIPLGVARHLNKNVWYPVHAYEVDSNGRSIARIGQKVRRVSFQSLEFTEMDELIPEGTANIITVEKIGG